MAGKTVRRFLADLGYRVHTPSEVFTRAALQARVEDTEWLAVVGRNGWATFCRDQKILERPTEVQAFLRARIHMFLLPGQATRQQLVELLAKNLADIGAVTAARKPDLYWLTTHGLENYERRTLRRRRIR